MGVGVGVGVSASFMSSSALPSFLPAAMRVNPPDIYINLKTRQAWKKLGNQVFTGAAVEALINCSRASNATQVDSLGNWSVATSNALARSDLGASIWEARTNSIRNNTMTGAVVMADGVELLTNGNFAAQGSGWTTVTSGGGSIVFSIGSVAITGDGSTFNNYISQAITGLTIGRNYVVVLSGATTPATFYISVGNSAGDGTLVNHAQVSANGSGVSVPDRVAFTATATSHWVSFIRGAASAASITSVSVNDGERLENGGFTSNPLNAAQNTVQNGWQWVIAGGTSTAAYNGIDTVTLTGDGTNAVSFDTSFPTVAGFTYTLSVDLSVTNTFVLLGTSRGAGTFLNVNGGAGTSLRFQFTATTSTTWLRFTRASASASTIKNVSVQSAGALPTNWSVSTAGFFYQIVNEGTTQGVDFVDIRLFGTSTSQFPAIFFESVGPSASYGQTWSASVFNARVASPDVANVSGQTVQFLSAAGGNFRATAFTANTTSTLTRGSGSYTMTNSADTSIGIKYALTMSAASGQTMDQTVRIGWPQLENNSLINSSVASATKAADGAAGVNGSAVYSVGGGTGTAATLNVTWAAGVMTVNSVASAGSYTVFPPSPATLTYVSGAATGWTGATVNLTPTDNSAKAAASNPILTTNAAATRNAEVDNLILTGLPVFGSSYTLWARGYTQTPNTYPASRIIIASDDGTLSNRSQIYEATGAGLLSYFSAPGTTAGVGGVWGQNNSSKVIAAFAANDQRGAINGTLTAQTTSATINTTNTFVHIGTVATGAAWLNGNIEEFAVWFTQRVPDAQCQSNTT